MAKQKDYLREFAEQVYEAKPGASLPAFWKKDSASWRVGPAAQAAMVALWRDGKLSCSGEPGNMTFYTTANRPGRFMFKVNGYLKAYITLIAFVYMLGWLATVGSQMGDIIGVCLAAAGFVGYICRVSLSYSHGPLAASGIPRDYSRFGYNVKVGAYTIGWVCAAGFLIVLGRRLMIDQYSVEGLSTLIETVKSTYHVEARGKYDVVPSAWAVAIGVGFGKLLGVFGAWFVGAGMVLGVDSSRHLMKFYGVYDKYSSQVNCEIADEGKQSQAMAMAFTAAIIFVAYVLRDFW